LSIKDDSNPQCRATKIPVKRPVISLEGKKIMDLFAPSHLLLLLLVILVIFGPSKLGDVGGALGKGIRDFKRAINEPDSKLGEN
jgi:TatA/E family protein of Tat protein translocase